MSIEFSTPGCMGQGAQLPLDGLYRMGQGEGKGVTGTSPALPLRGAAVYGVAVWGRLSCQLVLGSAGWLSLLFLLCDHLGGDMTLPGRSVSPLGCPQAAGLCLTQPGKQVLSSRWGLSGEGGCAGAFRGFPGPGL